MMGKKRGIYKMYSADNSVEVPKVSLWRMRQLSDTGECDPQQQDEQGQGDFKMACMDIDDFHEGVLNSVWLLFIFTSIFYLASRPM
jgi:hypothetical protein